MFNNKVKCLSSAVKLEHPLTGVSWWHPELWLGAIFNEVTYSHEIFCEIFLFRSSYWGKTSPYRLSMLCNIDSGQHMTTNSFKMCLTNASHTVMTWWAWDVHEYNHHYIKQIKRLDGYNSQRRSSAVNRVLKWWRCYKIKFVQLWEFSGYSERTTSKRPTYLQKTRQHFSNSIQILLNLTRLMTRRHTLGLN